MNSNVVVTAVNEIRTALSARQLTLVLGAGVTAAATHGHAFGSWQGLVEDAVDRCVQHGTRDDAWAQRAKADIASEYDDDLIAAAEKATGGLYGRRSPQFRGWLRDTVGSLSAVDTTLTDSIARYASRGSLIATTNYDSILEEALGWPVVTWRDSTRIQRVYRGDEQAVIHVHGYWREPESVVFGASSYADVLNDDHAAHFLRMTFWTKTVVFCGFGAGIRDPNFTALRKWLCTYPDSEYWHYRLVRSDEAEAAAREHAPDEHIKVVPFGQNHADLPKFLDAIVPDGPFRSIGESDAAASTPQESPPTAGTISIVRPAANRKSLEKLDCIASRLVAVREAAAHDFVYPAGSMTAAADPSQRDVFIRFQRAFADEAQVVIAAAAEPELTQVAADDLLRKGQRLLAMLEDPTS